MPKKTRSDSLASAARPVIEPLESRWLLSGPDVADLPADMKSPLYVTIGDQSSSDSEDWAMTVGDRSHLSGGYGQVSTQKRDFAKGQDYPIKVVHVGTNRAAGPDYDYRAWIDRIKTPTWGDGQQTASGPDYFVIDQNTPKLLQKDWYGDDVNAAQGKTATLVVPSLDVDIDTENQGGFAVPSNDPQADKDEGNLSLGKWIAADTGDVNGNGQPDYADLNGIAGGNFVPMVLRLSQNVAEADPTQVMLQFDYDASDPSIAMGDSSAGSGLTNPALGGHLRVWRFDADQSRYGDAFIDSGKPISAADLGLTPGGQAVVYIEAVGAKRGINSAPITVTASITGEVWSGTLTDTVNVRPIAVDLDADTHNDGTYTSTDPFAVPEQDQGEDHDEDLERNIAGLKLPGKVLAVNDGDADGDGIPDFADGFDRDGTSGNQDDGSTGVQFTPLSLRLPEMVDLSKAKLQFDYDASDPLSLTVSGTGTKADPYAYTPAPGMFRLWTKDGADPRNAQTVGYSGGTYVAPGVLHTYSPGDLGIPDGGPTLRTGTLWVEAIHPSVDLGDGRITVSLDPDGDGPEGFLSMDAVRLTSYGGLIRVDANHDGKISFDVDGATGNGDQTTAAKPYRFWINNDSDVQVENPDDKYAKDQLDLFLGQPGFEIDSRVSDLRSERNLEDFSSFAVNIPPGYSAYDPNWVMKLKMTGSDLTSVRFFGVTKDEAAGYLSDESIAEDLVQGHQHTWPIKLGTGDEYSLFVRDPELKDADQDVYHFLFDGVNTGRADLEVEFAYNGKVVAKDAVQLDLKPIEKLYEHWTVGDTTDWGDLRDPNTPPIPTSASLTSDSGPASERDLYDKDYILFVHGWRMKPVERRNFANTAYKRLFWQGYKGRFGMFSWPTEWVNSNSYVDVLTDVKNYDRSEQKAFNSAGALRNLLHSLDASYGADHVNLFAHSMGNIVASEALRQEAMAPVSTKIVNAYVASQAAFAAEAFDPIAPKDLFTLPQAPTTFDIYDKFPPTGAAYFSSISQAAGHLYNFFNPSDYALSNAFTWRENQRLKPDNGYEGSPLNPVFYRLSDDTSGAPTPLNLNYPPDAYEAFAYAAEPRSGALGATGVSGVFGGTPGSQVNLKAAFSFSDAKWDHDAQFNGTLMQRRGYWRKMMSVFGETLIS